MFQVTVKPSHPHKSFRRDGVLFTDMPTFLETLSDPLESERQASERGGKSWLVIVEVPQGNGGDASGEAAASPPGSPKKAKPQYTAMNLGALRDLCRQYKIPTQSSNRRPDLIRLLEGFDAKNQSAIEITQAKKGKKGGRRNKQ